MKADRARHSERMKDLRTKACAIVAIGKCPDCGAPLYNNSALAGWWQCAAFPCEAFRRPEHKNLPKCNFQTFTE